METDFYKVPLRTYLWLLVPAVLGIAIGLGLAHRSISGGGATVHASAAYATAPAARVTKVAPLPPRRIYRTARTRIGLTPMHVNPAWASRPIGNAVHPVEAQAVSSTSDESVVAFDAQPRNFSGELGDGTTTFQTSTPESTTPASTTPLNTTPIQITNVHTVSLTPLSATVAWHTSEPVNGQVAYGLDTESVWTAWDSASQDHVATVSGLAPNMTYRLWFNAHSSDGRGATSPFLLTTPPLAGSLHGSIGGGDLLVNGQSVFPTMVWSACSDSFDAKLAVGIDLFMGKDCGDASKQVSALADRGYFVGDAKEQGVSGAVGSFLPDEWDTFLPSSLTSSAVQRAIPDNGDGPRFLTLTNHFYSNAAPLPQGRGMYPALIQNADVVGFDLYPLQNWCRYDDFGHVFDAQRELVRLAAGKPTFQWIEARHMDCQDPSLDPTAETVRAETWLAIAGGAHAIGYFPYYFPASIGAEIARDKHDIQAIEAALLEPASLQADATGSVKVSARLHNGAIYVIAVNGTREPASTTITVPAIGNRQLTTLDGSRVATPLNGAFSDTFGPLEVRVYIAAPPLP